MYVCFYTLVYICTLDSCLHPVPLSECHTHGLTSLHTHTQSNLQVHVCAPAWPAPAISVFHLQLLVVGIVVVESQNVRILIVFDGKCIFSPKVVKVKVDTTTPIVHTRYTNTHTHVCFTYAGVCWCHSGALSACCMPPQHLWLAVITTDLRQCCKCCRWQREKRKRSFSKAASLSVIANTS